MNYESQKTLVLIVEDDPVQANAVDISLQRDKRIAPLIVHSAVDAFAAIELARTGETIALIVLDIDLEVEGAGYSVLAAAARPPRIPVIVLTGRSTVDFDNQAALHGGALTYMQKPYSPSILLSTVQNMIEISGGFIDIIEFSNGITYSISTRALMNGPMENQVILGEVQGHVFRIIAASGDMGANTNDILKQVWKNTNEPSRIVTNNVAHLRQRLKSNNIPLTVETMTKGRRLGVYRITTAE